MRAILAVCFIALLAAPSYATVSMLSQKKVTQVAAPAPGIDLCSTCVSFMDQFINQLLEYILNGGVIGSCAGLCSALPNQLEQTVCELLCDYVGITEFINLIQYEDPDPIYICQVMDLCSYTPGGAVNITRSYATPTSGPTGTTFTIGIDYTVISATSVGTLAISIMAPDGNDLGDGEFTEGQAPGRYNIAWQLQATPSEQESFGPGVYKIQMAVCAGDCTTAHPYGGVYAVGNTQFTITQ